MKKILTAFVKYPFYGKIFIVILVLLGGLSMVNMKKATFPMTESRNISVTVSYPGATPKEMEEGVTTLMENAIRGIPGIKEFSSVSRESMASVSITALSGYDMDELLQEVKNSVDGISNFPMNAERPIVSKSRRKDMALFATLISEEDDLMKLNSVANRIEDDLLATGKISQISISGIPSKIEISVEIDEHQLNRYDLTISDIQSAISANNLDYMGGTLKNPREEIKIIGRTRSTDPADIENIIIRSGQDGALIRIKDVADVKFQFEETPNAIFVKGKPAVSMMVQKLMNEDLQEISDIVATYMDDFNENNDDITMRVEHDFISNINSSLSILINNGLLGVVLIILLLTLLLNFRLSLWVAWGIPASFLGMFILAYMNGITLNMVSLFGMILIIGILVDDGVVIGENIFAHFEKGKTPRRAAIDGTMEVLPAVFTSVLTTIIAFVPLFFIEGNLEMMYDMGFVVVASLGFSLVEGMTVLPGHLGNERVLKPNREKSIYAKIRRGMDKLIFGLRDKIYIPFVKRIINNKRIALATVTALFIVTVGLFMGGKISFVFFPGQPGDTFVIDLALKPGVSEIKTVEMLSWIEEQVWEVNEELMNQHGDTTSYVASSQVSIGNAFNGSENGTHAGTVRIFLNPLGDTDLSDMDIKRAITEKTGQIPSAYKYAVGASNRFGAPVSISLLGYDEEVLELAKKDLETELGNIESLFNVTNNSQLGSQEVRIKLKPEGYALGLTQASLLQQVRGGFYGNLAQRFQEGKDEIWIYVRYPRSNRENIGQVENMMIHTQQGDYPLERIAELKTERSLSTINRFNGRREIRVEAYMKDQSESIKPILDYVEKEVLPGIMDKYPEITWQQQGQQKDSAEQMGSLLKYYGIAFLIIVLIIMIYFKSFTQGFMILLMIPLGFLGAVWGHAIHGQPISMMSLWGMVALSGTIINDAIVFLAKFNSNLVEGMKVLEAAIEAGRLRFRAIFLTTVTTTVGLMPLILVNSPDAQMLVPMAIALAYGILFGTIFILLIFPVVIMIGNRFNLNLKNFFRKEKLSSEDVEVAVINSKMEEKLNESMEVEF